MIKTVLVPPERRKRSWEREMKSLSWIDCAVWNSCQRTPAHVAMMGQLGEGVGMWVWLMQVRPHCQTVNPVTVSVDASCDISNRLFGVCVCVCMCMCV